MDFPVTELGCYQNSPGIPLSVVGVQTVHPPHQLPICILMSKTFLVPPIKFSHGIYKEHQCYSNGWMLSTDDKNFPAALMGFSHQSCNLQFAPTLTLPSPRSHDNKQRKILLHFEVEVCTLFLKSYISVRTWWSRSCPIRTTWSSSSWSSSSLWLSTGCFF